MVLAKQNLCCREPEPHLNQGLDPQPIAEPGDHCFTKHLVRARKHLHAGEQQPLKLDKRLLEEHHVVQIGGLEPAKVETKVDGILGKLVVVFLARRALFLRHRDQFTSFKQRRGRFAEIAGDT
jgi:hypothetical protein